MEGLEEGSCAPRMGGRARQSRKAKREADTGHRGLGSGLGCRQEQNGVNGNGGCSGGHRSVTKGRGARGRAGPGGGGGGQPPL